LSSDQQNAAVLLQNMLNQWGLGSLASKALGFIQQGYDATSVQYLLSQTPEYQKRFAANAARVKAGLAPLSPADYIATENAYQDILRSSGLPKGFYDSPDDFTDWISKDISPSELQGRVTQAVKFAQSTDPTYRQALAAYYGIDSGHIAAYFLDSSRALPLLQKQATAADIGAAALYNGLSLTNRDRAYQFADQGVTEQQARSAYSQIGSFLPTEEAIGQRFGQSYTQSDAEDELLGGLASAQRKRQSLNQQEQALFAGVGGVGQTYTHQSYGLSQDDSRGF
jgi:hypothetical protein